MDLVKKIMAMFNKKEKQLLFFLGILMFFGALLEAIGIGAVVPFVALIANPKLADTSKAFGYVRSYLPYKSYNQYVIICGLCLVGFYIFKNIFLIILLYLQNKFSFYKYVSVSKRLLGAYLQQPYEFHLKRNSSELMRNLSQVGGIFQNGVLIPMLTILSEGLIVLFVTIMLIITAPATALSAISLLGLATGVFYIWNRRGLKAAGRRQQFFTSESIKWIHQSLGGIKETKVMGKENFFLGCYEKNLKGLTDAICYGQIASNLPKYFIETVAIAAITLIVFSEIFLGKDVQSILPVLALFAFAAVRLMPSMTRIVSNLACLQTFIPAVDDVYNDLISVKADLKRNEGVQISLKESLELKNIKYRYPNIEKWVIDNLSIKINRGDAVAFVGSSGVGKTTLIDILMGLLKPNEGQVLVDGQNIYKNIRGWQRSIGYVPQFIFLIDDSICKNVAFGVPDNLIDESRVWKAIEMAQMSEFVEGLPDKLDTFIGERGVRLSGGQRQRLGIARALYTDPSILIFDEATSSLDYETEMEVTKAIGRLANEKTIILITHRLNTAEKCDVIFKLESGRVVGENNGSPYPHISEDNADSNRLA